MCEGVLNSCINVSQVCDNKRDCPNGADEGPGCAENSCAGDKALECSVRCLQTPNVSIFYTPHLFFIFFFFFPICITIIIIPFPACTDRIVEKEQHKKREHDGYWIFLFFHVIYILSAYFSLSDRTFRNVCQVGNIIMLFSSWNALCVPQITALKHWLNVWFPPLQW